MKKVLILTLIPLTALMLVASGVIYAVDNIDKIVEVKFADPNLEALVRHQIEKPGGTIHKDDVNSIQFLDTARYLTCWANDTQHEPITDLSGLEHFTGLKGLVLWESEVSDLSPLSGLIGLNRLMLHPCKVTDLSPLSKLSNLEHLSLSGCQISDLSPISALTNLTKLGLSDSSINDLSPISNLTKLKELFLSGNDISDLSPISNLTCLTWLSLEKNNISDLAPLSRLTNLTNLNLNENNINDLLLLLENDVLHVTKVTEADGSYYFQTTARLHVEGNPLSNASINEYIPQLREQGVIIFDEGD